MRTFRTVAVVAGLALVLSSCALVNSFVPDQQIANPLGIDNKPVTLSAVSTPALAPQATTTLSGTFSGSFPDIDASQIPAGIQPNGFTAPIDVSATASITTGTPGALPASFDLTKVTLSLHVEDGAGSPSFDLTPPYTHSGTLLTFTQTSTCTASPCEYSVTPGPDLGSALVALSLSSSDVATLWQIVTAGTSPNTASGTIAVDVDQTLPGDAELTVTLVSPTGTLTF